MKLALAVTATISLILIFSMLQNQVEREYVEKAERLHSEVLRNFSRIRGYNLDDVQLKIVTAQWIMEHWGAERIDPEYLENEEIFLKSLLLVYKNFSYLERKNKEVAGFRAFSWKGAVYVVYDNFDPESKDAAETIAHELEHIVQERYFKLKGDGSYDGEKAHAVTIEGDAVLAGWVYTGKKISDKVCVYEINEANCLDFLHFYPYTQGTRFVAKAYLEGGYKKVNEILKNPPRTTEQIVHPEKYYSNETFSFVENDIMPEKMEVIKKDRLGELFLFVFLASHLNDSVASKAAEGWDGDSYVLYKNSTGFIWQWKIAWDSKADVKEFCNALRDALNKTGNYNGSWFISKDYINQRIKVEQEGAIVVIEGRALNTL